MMSVKKFMSAFGSHKDTPVCDESRRIAAAVQSRTPVKLHFGSGPRILKGWLNFDLIFTPYQDYLKYYRECYAEDLRGDREDFFAHDIIEHGLPLPDDSVDIIFHEDFLEHLGQKEQIIILAEGLRVLKPGGVHRINTPDLIASMRQHSDFVKGRKGIFLDEWDKSGHVNLLTHATLKEMALLVGYSRVDFNGKNRSGCPLVPLEYRPDPNDRPEKGNLFADIVK